MTESLSFVLKDGGKHESTKRLYLVNEDGEESPIVDFIGANFSHKHDYFAQQVTEILNRHADELDAIQAISMFI